MGNAGHAVERVDIAMHRLGAARAILSDSESFEQVSDGPVFDEESGEGGL